MKLFAKVKNVRGWGVSYIPATCITLHTGFFEATHPVCVPGKQNKINTFQSIFDPKKYLDICFDFVSCPKKIFPKKDTF